MAKPAATFVLTQPDHAILQGWSRMGSLVQRLGQRAKILLLADGLTPKAVSEQLQDARSLVERSVTTSIDLMSLKATIYFYHDDFLP